MKIREKMVAVCDRLEVPYHWDFKGDYQQHIGALYASTQLEPELALIGKNWFLGEIEWNGLRHCEAVEALYYMVFESLTLSQACHRIMNDWWEQEKFSHQPAQEYEQFEQAVCWAFDSPFPSLQSRAAELQAAPEVTREDVIFAMNYAAANTDLPAAQQNFLDKKEEFESN